MRFNQDVIILPERLKAGDRTVLKPLPSGMEWPSWQVRMPEFRKNMPFIKDRKDAEILLWSPSLSILQLKVEALLPSRRSLWWEGNYRSCGVCWTHGSFCSHIWVMYRSLQSHCKGVWETHPWETNEFTLPGSVNRFWVATPKRDVITKPALGSRINGTGELLKLLFSSSRTSYSLPQWESRAKQSRICNGLIC